MLNSYGDFLLIAAALAAYDLAGQVNDEDD